MTTPDETDEAIISALARVNASLRIVLAAIAELKAEMDANRFQDVPVQPDDTWVGAP